MLRRFLVAAVAFMFAGLGMTTTAQAAVVTGTAAAAYNGDGTATYSWRIDAPLADIVLFQAPQEGPEYKNEYNFSQPGSITYPVDETTRCWEIWTGWYTGDLADRQKLGGGCLDLSAPTPDADGDGVGDTIDYCPDTAPGARVDEAGCSVDQQDGSSFERESLEKRCVNSRVVAYAEYELVIPGDTDGYGGAVWMNVNNEFYTALLSTDGSIGTASYLVPLGETVTVTLVDPDAMFDAVRDVLTLTGAACDDGGTPVPPKGSKASCPKGKPVWVDGNDDGWIQPKECQKA